MAVRCTGGMVGCHGRTSARKKVCFLTTIGRLGTARLFAGLVLPMAGLFLSMAGCTNDARPVPSTQVRRSPAPQPRPRTQPPAAHSVTVSAADAPVEHPPAEENHPAVAAPITPQPVYRPDDQRPPHDDQRLAALGIRKHESRRLRLYTDIPDADARPLPELIDRAFDALTAYFGPLPPARDGSEFQMTGYLLRSEALFREAGLIPEDLPTFQHGRHRRNEFWMRDQEYDYYRRHLLIHEVTHCVMTYLPDRRAPVWYFEGMAELFGTHRLEADGTFAWGVMPDSPEHFAGLGRITLVREDYSQGRGRSIPQILRMRPEEFLEPSPYAWSWALCHFLAQHPRYRERFQQLGQHLTGDQFEGAWRQLFGADARDLATEWALFALNLQYGYDMERSAIEFRSGTPLAKDDPPREAAVRADRGWQSAGVLVEAGGAYHLEARGRFTLADVPKPWESEPQGVSIRYFDGFPLGQLLACIRQETLPQGDDRETMLKVLPVGRARRFVAPVTGTLYLRVNDSWSELADNRGEVQVLIWRGD
jgi:hypothetical protein